MPGWRGSTPGSAGFARGAKRARYERDVGGDGNDRASFDLAAAQAVEGWGVEALELLCARWDSSGAAVSSRVFVGLRDADASERERARDAGGDPAGSGVRECGGNGGDEAGAAGASGLLAADGVIRALKIGH